MPAVIRQTRDKTFVPDGPATHNNTLQPVDRVYKVYTPVYRQSATYTLWGRALISKDVTALPDYAAAAPAAFATTATIRRNVY